MKFRCLPPFLLEGKTISVPATPVAGSSRQSAPGLSRPGSCSLSTQSEVANAASVSASGASNALEGHGEMVISLPPLGLGPPTDRPVKLFKQYHYYPSFLKISEPGRSILSSSHSKRARRSLTSRGIQFADASGRPLTNTKEISRWITPADRQMRSELCAYSSKLTLCEEGMFPSSTENCPPHTSYSHWLNSSDATTIAGGKHRGRLGYILQYSRCNQYLKVRLVSPDPEFYLHEPVIVKRKHIYSSAPGSLTPTTKPQKNEDQCVDSDIAGDDSLCNFVAEDDDYQLEDMEEEEEDDPAPATITGRKHQCPFVLKGPPTKRRRVAVAVPTPTKSKQEIPALAFKVEQYITIAGGKYAGQKCIILKHLARRVSIQLVDSGLVTCISRRSLGLDEEKTVWHAKPRRSPRIKAMMEASEKSCDDMDGGNP